MKHIVITTRVGCTAVQGSGVSKCSECGESVNISPSTVQLMGEKPNLVWEFVCMECSLPVLRAGATVVPPTKDQLREIREHFEKGEM